MKVGEWECGRVGGAGIERYIDILGDEKKEPQRKTDRSKQNQSVFERIVKGNSL